MTTSTSTIGAATLTATGREGFAVIRTVGDVIFLRTPGAALNAAEYLSGAGIEARAEIVGGQWAVRVG